MGRTDKKKTSTPWYRIEAYEEKNKGFSLHSELFEGSEQYYKS